MRRLFFLFLCAGCADEPRTVEDSVQIDHGFYGQMTIAADTSPGHDGVDTQATVQLYRMTPGRELLADTMVDENGVYQITVELGAYELCARRAPPDRITTQWQMNCAGPCTLVVFSDGLVRADWQSNLSGGWWSAGEHCPR
jgi:hypothetical protein